MQPGLGENRDLITCTSRITVTTVTLTVHPCAKEPPPCTVCLSEGGGRLTREHHYTPGPNTVAAGKSIATHIKQQDTHHITNGGDVSDSHLVYSVPLTAIFIK